MPRINRHLERLVKAWRSCLSSEIYCHMTGTCFKYSIAPALCAPLMTAMTPMIDGTKCLINLAHTLRSLCVIILCMITLDNGWEMCVNQAITPNGLTLIDLA